MILEINIDPKLLFFSSRRDYKFIQPYDRGHRTCMLAGLGSCRTCCSQLDIIRVDSESLCLVEPGQVVTIQSRRPSREG